MLTGVIFISFYALQASSKVLYEMEVTVLEVSLYPT